MHFTYSSPDLDNLQQGDVLKKTPELLNLIREIHPHYANDSYLYFQVLTQSCDLVRRKGGICKSRYITLAAVRSLDFVIKRAIEKFSDRLVLDGKILCSNSYKNQLQDFINKLFNNNDTNHFFLNAEPDLGFLEDCCTHLHLSISIRAYEHYEVCLKSKVLELEENFRAKLGWLVGNLYSRVGTEDYVPTKIPTQKEFEKFIDEKMNSHVGWIPKDDFQEFKNLSAGGESLEKVKALVSERKNKKREALFEQLANSISRALKIEDEDQKTKLKNVLNNNTILAKL